MGKVLDHKILRQSLKREILAPKGSSLKDVNLMPCDFWSARLFLRPLLIHTELPSSITTVQKQVTQ